MLYFIFINFILINFALSKWVPSIFLKEMKPKGSFPKSVKFLKISSLRGGSSDISSNDDKSSKKSTGVNQEDLTPRPITCSVIVSTSIGSAFLDKKKRLSLDSNSTILDLKLLLSEKFPGGPPVILQKLFFGTTLLNDTQIVSNITTISPVPLLLDMLSGTSAYNRTLSISQALEAYASLMTQQAYLGDKMRSLYAAESGFENTLASAEIMDSAVYREMFSSINASIYEKYKEDIEKALIREMEPEISSADTNAWRGNKIEKSSLALAIAKEFDFNLRSIKSFIYYSILLLIFAKFGTNSKDSGFYLFSLIPVLWISKLRQLRLIYRLFIHLFIPMVPYIGFLMPILPAPLRVLAEESYKWETYHDEVLISKSFEETSSENIKTADKSNKYDNSKDDYKEENKDDDVEDQNENDEDEPEEEDEPEDESEEEIDEEPEEEETEEED